MFNNRYLIAHSFFKITLIVNEAIFTTALAPRYMHRPMRMLHTSPNLPGVYNPNLITKERASECYESWKILHTANAEAR